MKETIVALLIVAWSITIFGMQPQGYLELLPQDLKQELVKFTTDLSDIKTFDELQQKLKEAERAATLKGMSSFAQALDNLQKQLERIKKENFDLTFADLKALQEHYTMTLANLKVMAADRELKFLFNPDFNRILIEQIQRFPYLTRYREIEDIAKELGTPGALEWLRQLHFVKAALQGNIDEVRQFLTSGINVNAKHIFSNTALILAADRGHKDIVELLLAHGADVNVQNILSNTALMVAINKGHKEIVALLLDKGAHVNTQKTGDDTVLMQAARDGNKDIVEMLIASGANVNYRNRYGNTALTCAARKGHKEIVKLLMHHLILSLCYNEASNDDNHSLSQSYLVIVNPLWLFK